MNRTKAKPGPPLRPASAATATHEDRMTMTTPADDDLIRRGDALEAIKAHSLRAPMATVDTAAFLIRALAAQVQPAPVAVEPETPAAKWRVNGEPDPHSTRYDCERAKLAKGDLTDDELANAIYMADRNSFDLIVWQTAAKDRIRWLSRALEAAVTARPVAEVIAEAVAGAFAAAASSAYDWHIVTAEDMRDAILALTPTDAQAALDRRDAATRKAALREALAAIAALARGASVETVQGQEQAYNAILALIEEQKE